MTNPQDVSKVVSCESKNISGEWGSVARRGVDEERNGLFGTEN